MEEGDDENEEDDDGDDAEGDTPVLFWAAGSPGSALLQGNVAWNMVGDTAGDSVAAVMGIVASDCRRSLCSWLSVLGHSHLTWFSWLIPFQRFKIQDFKILSLSLSDIVSF